MFYRLTSNNTGAGIAGDQFKRNVRAVLNKLTPENFQKLIKELSNYNFCTPNQLNEVVTLIFEKAVDESKYCRLYALLCVRLNSELPNFEEKGCVFTTFQKLLLTKLQREFDRRRHGNVDPGSREKRQLLGLSAFIGELYQLRLIREITVHECLKDLLRKEDAEALECLVAIMETSGEQLDHDQAKNLMNQYFKRIQKFSNADQLPSRVRFRLLDLIDLRSRDWRHRRQVAGPRPVSEIRAEYGTNLDPTKISAPVVPVGQSRILRDSELAKRRPDRTNEFFLRPSATKKNEPEQEPPSTRSSFSDHSNGISNGTPSSPVKPTRYLPPRRAADSYSEKPKPAPVPEKKSFVPAFIKSNNANQMNDRTSSSLKYQPKPHFSSRSGLPGQGLNAPSPLDKVNNARSLHLKRNIDRRNSPGRTSNSSPARGSPNQSPIRNGHYSPIRNSPNHASPISPLVDESMKAENKPLTVLEILELSKQMSYRYVTKSDESILADFPPCPDITESTLVDINLFLLERAVDDKENSEKWTKVIKTWNNSEEIVSKAFKKWIQRHSSDKNNDSVKVISELILCGFLEPIKIVEFFADGKFYPLFFLIMKEIFDSTGKITFLQRKFAELDFLGLLEKRDRTELRTILAEYKLLFLRPKFSDEQFLFTERGLEPSDYYRAMKSRGDHGATAGAVINLVWEKQLDFAKVKPLLVKLLRTKPKIQCATLKAVVLAHNERGMQKDHLLKQFILLYDEDIVEEDGFLLWEKDIHDQTPGRQKGLEQVSRWLQWLKEADVESDDEISSKSGENNSPQSNCPQNAENEIIHAVKNGALELTNSA
ncbi:Oidioi.mRNA.OKI2018_I69.XSR.g16237.t1.cds [Oikopleura dioica]|uniref:Eukaryotic translation initiation factor 4 gamma 2 n=1 Tax=Oikopleura dioica TaxID=34765 RepID=A0ABN7SKK0_OIKDI|nr:Oidioi.mRNA.OKI2018_I69.XSR.g16237.t1.cds [Oikopleura dioica]